MDEPFVGLNPFLLIMHLSLPIVHLGNNHIDIHKNMR